MSDKEMSMIISVDLLLPCLFCVPTGQPIEYFAWDELNPQPNNYWQWCILMQTTGGIWIDRDCSLLFPFICKTGIIICMLSLNDRGVYF